MTKPSPLAAITSSIRSLISFAVFPLYSIAYSIRPWISFKHARMFFFRKVVERCNNDCPLRKSRSKTLTMWKVSTRNETNIGDLQQGRGLCSFFDLSWKWCSQDAEFICGQYDLPKAAVFNVPNGRLRSDTGSHTSISPSKMILKRYSQTTTIKKGKKGFTRLYEDRTPCRWRVLNFQLQHVCHRGRCSPCLSYDELLCLNRRNMVNRTHNTYREQ